MKGALERLVDLVLKNDEYDPWIDSIDPIEALETVEEEVKELRRELEIGNFENIEEEMGDLLWTVFIVLSVLKRKGFDPDRIVEKLEGKMKKRKPYIFEGKRVDLEQAKRIWRMAKGEG